MARNHAHLDTAGISDPDWKKLSPGAQWLYVLLLRQPRLSLVGHLDVLPARWAQFAAGVAVPHVEGWFAELVAGSYLLHDEATGEVLVRTFTRHDLTPQRMTEPVAKGFWSAWSGVLSEPMRRYVVANMPDDLWNKIAKHGPTEAAEIRRSGPIEWEVQSPLECEVQSPFESPVSCLLPPVSVDPAPVSGPLTTPDPEPLTADEIDQRTNRAVGKLANLRAVGGDNPGGLARHIGENLPEHERAELRDLIAAGSTPEDAAAVLADPLHGMEGMAPYERRHDPAELARVSEAAAKREADTKKKLAEIGAAPEQRLSLDEIRAMRERRADAS